MARSRDYRAERERRNAEARRWGFTSLDQLSKARRRGEFPSRAELQRDPSAGIRAMIARDERDMQAFERERTVTRRERADRAQVSRTRANAKYHDAESREWSKQHSRQKQTKFNPKWSAAKKEQYYQTFVRPWGQKRTTEQMTAYREWMEDMGVEYESGEDPYSLR